jgi:hypothetical protein
MMKSKKYLTDITENKDIRITINKDNSELLILLIVGLII